MKSPLKSVREPGRAGGGLAAQTHRRGGCSGLCVQGKAPGQQAGQMYVCVGGAGGSTVKHHDREVSQTLLRASLFWVFFFDIRMLFVLFAL